MVRVFEVGKKRWRKLPAPKRACSESIPPLWRNCAAMTYTPNQHGTIHLRLPPQAKLAPVAWPFWLGRCLLRRVA